MVKKSGTGKGKGCRLVERVERTNKKPGPKTVSVKSYTRSPPKKCK